MKPQGPAYKVNPHYVTPQDIEADSLEGKQRAAGSYRQGPQDPAGGTVWNLPQQPQYGYSMTPGYGLPGYGLPGYELPGYGVPAYGTIYGVTPWFDYGSPGFGGNPLLYPYTDGYDLADPYNLMIQPYVP